MPSAGPGSGVKLSSCNTEEVKECFKSSKAHKDSDVFLYKLSKDFTEIVKDKDVCLHADSDSEDDEELQRQFPDVDTFKCEKFRKRWQKFVGENLKEEKGYGCFAVVLMRNKHKQSQALKDKAIGIKFCPENESAKNKMVMAATWSAFKSYFEKADINAFVEACDLPDLDYSNLTKD